MKKRSPETGSKQLWLGGVPKVAISIMPPHRSAISEITAGALRQSLGSVLKEAHDNHIYRLITRNDRTVGLVVPPEIGEIVRENREKIRLSLAAVQLTHLLSRIEYRGESFIIESWGEDLAIMGPVGLLDKIREARAAGMTITVPDKK